MVWTAIAIGGALGSMARHAVNHVIQSDWLSARFPAGTLIVNLAGCLVIGVLAGLLASDRVRFSLPWREFVFVGLLGGFTTFSSFGLDTFLLSRTHSPAMALTNVLAQVVGGLLAVWAGYHMATARF
jgi:CrcB protein